MSYFNTKKEFSLRDLLYRALIFIGTVGIIVYFLPRDGKFNYQFDIDKPWKYGHWESYVPQACGERCPWLTFRWNVLHG